jgi:hypothetical protein
MPLLYVWLKMLGVEALRKWLRFTKPTVASILSVTLLIIILLLQAENPPLPCGHLAQPARNKNSRNSPNASSLPHCALIHKITAKFIIERSFPELKEKETLHHRCHALQPESSDVELMLDTAT